MFQIGGLTQQRAWFAKWADRLPFAAEVGVAVHWITFAWMGWWFTYAFVVINLALFALVPLVTVWPYLWAVQGWLWWGVSNAWSVVWMLPWGEASAFVLAATAAGGAYRLKKLRQNIDDKQAALIRAAVRAFVVVFCVSYTMWKVGPVAAGVMVVGPFIGWGVDMQLGKNDKVLLIRRWAQDRREWAVRWALAASQTKQVQSGMNDSVEQNVTLAAKLRPLFEAPARGLPFVGVVFDFESFSVEEYVFPPPGRTFEELKKVMPVLSANMPTIEDRENSMQLQWGDREETNHASWTRWRISYKRADVARVPMPWHRPDDVVIEDVFGG